MTAVPRSDRVADRLPDRPSDRSTGDPVVDGGAAGPTDRRTSTRSTSDAGASRDRFTLAALGGLAEVLEDAFGREEAEGLIGLVGGRIGVEAGRACRDAAGPSRLDRTQVAAALVDVQQRIDGGFAIESIDDEKIVLTNTDCPLGGEVVGRPSLCALTSNVFGRIAADNLGYARVELGQTIARGDGACRVVVWFTEDGGGREYFG